MQETLFHLECIFGPISTLDELIDRIDACGFMLVDRLYHTVSVSKQRETRPAVLHLYPSLESTLINGSGHIPSPSFAQISSVIGCWAALVSRELQAVFAAAIWGEFQRIDALIKAGPIPIENLSASRSQFGFDMVQYLRLAHSKMIKYWNVSPAAKISIAEINGVAHQFKGLNPDESFYTESNHLYIRINPCNDIESVLASVRKIVEDEQASIELSHHEGWSDTEKEFYGEEWIDAQKPAHEFTFKKPGNKGRTLQTFIDESFHALLVYSLRQTMKPVDMERNLFGVKPDGYAAAAKANTGHNARAERLIYNVLSGFPIHL